MTTPAEITDAMVVAALDAYWQRGEGVWEFSDDDLKYMRRALEAALGKVGAT